MHTVKHIKHYFGRRIEKRNRNQTNKVGSLGRNLKTVFDPSVGKALSKFLVCLIITRISRSISEWKQGFPGFDSKRPN